MRVAVIAAAVVAGAGGWLLLGPPGAIIGVVAGPVVLVVALAVFAAFCVPDAADHMAGHEPYLALTEVRQGQWAARTLARWWPEMFFDVLAGDLLTGAEALTALGRPSRAIGPAAEAVTLYRDAVARKPRKHEAGLARALDRQSQVLAAVGRLTEAAAGAGAAARLYRSLSVPDPGTHLPALVCSLTCQAGWLEAAGQDSAALAAAAEAAGICRDRLPRDDQPSCTARAFLLQGRLLAGAARYHEAARPLARGWDLAAGPDEEGLRASAVPALRATYRADQSAFRDAWRIEADGNLPGWLTGQPPSP